MTDNVIDLPVVTSLPIAADKILRQAIEDGLETVIVIGQNAEGEFYLNTSDPSPAKNLWLIENVKLLILHGEFE